jgi:CRISPR-associated protein Cas4
MEEYIQISKINDFTYSPQSLYLHSVYESFNQNVYHEESQKIGQINHENIENGTYSTTKKYLQGLSVYSETYNLGGKIDIYDTEKKILIERKTKIHKIYNGHRFQLYAQMFALEEMGHPVEEMYIHSLDDNRRYKIPKPTFVDMLLFEETLKKIRNYNPLKKTNDDFKTTYSIYRHLDY